MDTPVGAQAIGRGGLGGHLVVRLKRPGHRSLLLLLRGGRAGKALRRMPAVFDSVPSA